MASQTQNPSSNSSYVHGFGSAASHRRLAYPGGVFRQGAISRHEINDPSSTLVGFDSAVELSNSSQGIFDPASRRRLSYRSGVFHQGAISLHEINDAGSSNWRNYVNAFVVVHNHHNIIQLPPISTLGNEQPVSNRPRLPESFLGITSQTTLAALAIWTSSSTNFSQNGKILFCSAVVLNAMGFLCCLFSILLFGRETGVAPRIVTGAGFVFTAYGFLAIVGSMLSESMNLWVTGLVCILCFPALAATFLNRFSVQPPEALSGEELV